MRAQEMRRLSTGPAPSLAHGGAAGFHRQARSCGLAGAAPGEGQGRDSQTQTGKHPGLCALAAPPSPSTGRREERLAGL